MEKLGIYKIYAKKEKSYENICGVNTATKKLCRYTSC